MEENDTSSPHGGESDAGTDAGSDAGKDAGRPSSKSQWKDPEKARKAASVRWAKQRARESAPESSDVDRVLVCQTPTRVDKIMRGLEREAVNGNANAARELRAWMQDYPPQETDISLATMKRSRRQAILARLDAECEAEDAAGRLAERDDSSARRSL